MDETTKTIIYSILGIILSLSLISAVWLGVENKRIYSHYLEEKASWYQKNRDLEFKLDKFSSEIGRIEEKLSKSQSYIAELKEQRLTSESKLKKIAAENGKLREEVTRLVKEKGDLEKRLKQHSGTSIVEKNDSFWSNLLREKSNLEMRLNSMQRLLEKKDSEIAQFNQEKDKLNQALNELLNKKMELGNKLNSAKKIVSSLSQSLEQHKKEELVYIEQIKKMEQDKKSLELELAQAQEARKGLNNEIKQLKQNIAGEKAAQQKFAQRVSYINQILEDKMLEVTRLKQDLEVALQNVKKLSYDTRDRAVELPKIEVNSGIKGKILSVNPEEGFVIINLGRRDNIEIGAKFNVYRNKKLIAKLQIIDIGEATSAAKILLSLPQNKIAPNDLVLMAKE